MSSPAKLSSAAVPIPGQARRPLVSPQRLLWILSFLPLISGYLSIRLRLVAAWLVELRRSRKEMWRSRLRREFPLSITAT